MCRSAYEQFGIPLPRTTSKQVRAATLPDTGAQIVVAGLNVVHALGVTKKELVPVSTKVSGANNLDLRIIRLFPLSLSHEW